MNRGTLLENLWDLLTANIGTKLISVVIAIVLWFVVLGSRNVEATKDIPLEVVTPSELVVSNDLPDKISFRLSGPKAFLRSVLDRREEPVRVNLAGAKAGLVTYRFFSDNIRVPIGVKVLSINPTAILIKLETVKHKEVPVRPSSLARLRMAIRSSRSNCAPKQSKSRERSPASTVSRS